MADDPRVDRLLEELLESGGRPEDVCRSCPELLPQVRIRWQRLRQLEQEVDALFPSSGASGGHTPAVVPTDELPRLDGYEVQGELGRGGMGVVYRARHLRLNRPVALKMLLAGPFSRPVERERFLREAEAVAGLSHPNLVPVYDVGDVGGWPYFTMEFVEGGSLAQRLTGEPWPPRRAAALLATLAEAVQAAHRGGIVHRDLKPSNVLLAADGTPKIADFGLARRLEDGGGLTLSGAPLGTPSYMAPEQARGEKAAIGPATDVYALGAILYELLTGRPPFRGETPTATLQQVVADEPVPPARLNSRVPRDLETICLSCLEKDPRRRYPTARALADDLRAWLEGWPIAARRAGATERAWLWCRRKPAVAVLTAAVVLAVVGGTATTIAVQAAANRRLDRKNADLKAANDRVKARYDLAVEAIKTFHTGVSEDFLLKQDQFHELRDRLLKSAADFYGKLSALLERETDPASRRSLLALNDELATLTARVGRTEDALAAHRAVLAAREALAAEPGADAAATVDVGRSVAAVASLLGSTGKTAEAEAAYRRAESLLAGPAGSDPAARAALATCRARLGTLLSDTGRTAVALSTYERARADQEALAAAPGAGDHARRDLADTVIRIGNLLFQTGRLTEAEGEFRKALAIQARLAADNPAVVDFRSRLANSHTNLGILLKETGRPTEAEAEYRKALAIQARLAADNPAVADFRNRLAGSHSALASLLNETGRPGEAEAEYRKALAIQERVAADNPAVAEFRNRLAISHNNLGNLLSKTGRPTEAEAEYRKALAIQERLAADNPAVTEFRSLVANSHNDFGDLLKQTGRPSAAEAEYRRALEIRQKLAADNPKVPEYRNDLATSRTDLAVILRRLGRPAEARDGCEQAVAIREALIREVTKVSTYRSGLARSYHRRGLARRDLGDPAGAAADARRALALWDGLPSRTGQEWFDTACARAALAGLAGRDGAGVSAAEAAGEAETAVALLHKAVAMGYRSLDAFRTDDALDPIRDRPDFQLLMTDLAMPADPFARSD